MNLLENIDAYENLATLCKISYNISSTINYEFDKSDKSQVNLFNHLSQKITHIETTYLNPNPNVLSLISNDLKELYIVISGSDDINDFTDDLNILQKSPFFGDPQIKFHTGFLKQACGTFNNIFKKIKEFKTKGGTDIYLTGHSSGGCIVSIVAYYLIVNDIVNYSDLQVITFGSPRFTNDIGSQWFNNNTKYYRVELHKDPVPRLPMFNSYKHVSKNHIYIKKSNIFINIKRSKMPSFINFIKRLFINVNNLHYHTTTTYLENLILVKHIYTKL
jgi:hypothetical protein